MMRRASKIPKPSRGNKLCHFYTSNHGYVAMDTPVMSNEFSCPFCETSEFFLWEMENNQTCWTCGRVCSLSRLPKSNKPTSDSSKPKRAILWHLFCEINGIGDLYHDVAFEKVNQTDGKIAFMLGFATKPQGIILMRGHSGTGKTYCALAICEMFTRKNASAIFTTQNNLSARWLEIVRGEKIGNFLEQVRNTYLLVVDDFGLAEPAPGFLSYFMDLINIRMQWKERGTIITTNLPNKKLGDYCGESLADRIMTGQIFDFKGETRRKTKDL